MAFVFTMPDNALLLAPVAMLVRAGACTDSCDSGLGLGRLDGAVLHHKDRRWLPSCQSQEP